MSEIECLGTDGQLLGLVTRELTMLVMGSRTTMSLTTFPFMNSRRVGEMMSLFCDCSPEKKTEMVMEQISGPAGDFARILEFLDRMKEDCLSVASLSCEGGSFNSLSTLLAIRTIFRTPG